MNPINRRELLAHFLGISATAPLIGCDTQATFDGSIVGPSLSIGHKLRDGFIPQPREDQWSSCQTLIVGGGIAGLTAGWRFLRSGMTDFQIWELEKQPGGTACSAATTPVPAPWGAHYVPAPLLGNPISLLFDEMALFEGNDPDGNPIVKEELLCRDPQERLFIDGRWSSGLWPESRATTADLEQWNRFSGLINEWVRWRDPSGRRAFEVPHAACSSDTSALELDHITMSEWLAQHDLHSPVLKWQVDYACRDDYGMTSEHTSAWAGLYYFAARVKSAENDSQPFITWPEGNGRIVDHMSNKNASQLKVGVAACKIEEVENGIEVVGFDTSRNQALGVRCKHVVFAAPQFLAPYLIHRYREDEARLGHVNQMNYSPWMVTNLELASRPHEPGFPLSWDNVIYDSPSLGYVCATHQRGMDYGPTVWTHYYPFCRQGVRDQRIQLEALTWDECCEIVLSDLEKAHPDIRDCVSSVNVMKWGHAMIRPEPNVITEHARSLQVQVGNIHFAHTDLSGMGLCEEAYYHGVRAAESILSRLNIESPSIL